MFATSLTAAVLVMTSPPTDPAVAPPDDLAAVHAYCTSDEILQAYLLDHDAIDPGSTARPGAMAVTGLDSAI